MIKGEIRYVENTIHVTGNIKGSGKVAGKIQKASGVTGNVMAGGMVDAPAYTGATTVTPKARQEQVLNTSNKLLKSDIVVLEIPYFETSNENNGYTVYIGNEV